METETEKKKVKKKPGRYTSSENIDSIWNNLKKVKFSF